MIINIKDSQILKDLTQVGYSSGSHGFLGPKLIRKDGKECVMAMGPKTVL